MILYYLLGWQLIPEYKPSGKNSTTKVTIVVPARNEQDNLPKLLDCIKKQDYPKELFEVFVVDDHSTDLTPDIVDTCELENVYLIKLADYVESKETAFKKRAVEIAVSKSSGELILTSDADCLMGSQWISTVAAFYEETGSKFIVAPVAYRPVNSFIDHLEALDFMSVMGVTGATVQHKLFSLSNGANMAYEKEVFLNVNGYEGIDQTPSGDDVFLIEKIGKKFPYHINYLKNTNAIVYTQPVGNLKGLISQRMRWMSKTPYYSDKRTIWAGVIVLIFYATLLLNIVLSFINPAFINLLLMQIMIKVLVDFVFAKEVSKFFKSKNLLYYFPALETLHLPFVVVVSIMSQILPYSWKSRKY